MSGIPPIDGVSPSTPEGKNKQVSPETTGIPPSPTSSLSLSQITIQHLPKSYRLEYKGEIYEIDIGGHYATEEQWEILANNLIGLADTNAVGKIFTEEKTTISVQDKTLLINTQEKKRPTDARALKYYDATIVSYEKIVNSTSNKVVSASTSSVLPPLKPAAPKEFAQHSIGKAFHDRLQNKETKDNAIGALFTVIDSIEPKEKKQILQQLCTAFGVEEEGIKSFQKIVDDTALKEAISLTLSSIANQPLPTFPADTSSVNKQNFIPLLKEGHFRLLSKTGKEETDRSGVYAYFYEENGSIKVQNVLIKQPRENGAINWRELIAEAFAAAFTQKAGGGNNIGTATLISFGGEPYLASPVLDQYQNMHTVEKNLQLLKTKEENIRGNILFPYEKLKYNQKLEREQKKGVLQDYHRTRDSFRAVFNGDVLKDSNGVSIRDIKGLGKILALSLQVGNDQFHTENIGIAQVGTKADGTPSYEFVLTNLSGAFHRSFLFGQETEKPFSDEVAIFGKLNKKNFANYIENIPEEILRSDEVCYELVQTLDLENVKKSLQSGLDEIFSEKNGTPLIPAPIIYEHFVKQLEPKSDIIPPIQEGQSKSYRSNLQKQINKFLPNLMNNRKESIINTFEELSPSDVITTINVAKESYVNYKGQKKYLQKTINYQEIDKDKYKQSDTTHKKIDEKYYKKTEEFYLFSEEDLHQAELAVIKKYNKNMKQDDISKLFVKELEILASVDKQVPENQLAALITEARKNSAEEGKKFKSKRRQPKITILQN